MKVLFHEIPNNSIGGSKISLFNMILGFEGQIEATVIAYFPPYYKNILRNYAKIIDPPAGLWHLNRKIDRYGKIAKSISWWMFTLYLVLKIIRVVQKEKIDIIHCNNEVNSNAPAIMASSLMGIPCICHLRGVEKPLKETKHLYKKVDSFIAVSQFVKQAYMDFGLVEADNCNVIYNSININDFQNSPRTFLRKKFQIREDELLVGMIGRPIEYKGYHYFVKVAAHVRKQVNHIRFIIIGKIPSKGQEGYSYYSKVNQLASSYGIREELIFCEYEEGMMEIIGCLDALLLCSPVDNFGRVLFEGMAAKVPVISFDTGGIREVVEHLQNGIIVPCGNAEEMARGVIRILQDAEIRNRLIQNGFQKACTHFDRKENSNKVLKLYYSVLDAKGRGLRHLKEGIIK